MADRGDAENHCREEQVLWHRRRRIVFDVHVGGGVHGLLGEQRDNRVHLRVDTLDLGYVRFHDVPGGEVLGVEATG